MFIDGLLHKPFVLCLYSIEGSGFWFSYELDTVVEGSGCDITGPLPCTWPDGTEERHDKPQYAVPDRVSSPVRRYLAEQGPRAAASVTVVALCRHCDFPQNRNSAVHPSGHSHEHRRLRPHAVAYG
jgi:hypothetical protein